MARICSARVEPPTCASSAASGISRARTVRVACRNDARIIDPESTRVPSRSKRTTGNRIDGDAIHVDQERLPIRPGQGLAYGAALAVPAVAVLPTPPGAASGG